MIGKNVTIRSQAELQASQTSAPTQGFQGCENPDLQNHPRTRFSCHAALDEAACAPFSKERLMKCQRHQVPQEIRVRGDLNVARDPVLGWTLEEKTSPGLL